MEGLHPITCKQEVSVDVKVAAVVAVHLGTERLHDLSLVEVILDPVELIVAQAAALALLADIIWILSSALVRANDGIIAVDRGWNTRPDALALIAVRDQTLAAWKSVVHALAFGFGQHRGPAAVTASHWAIVFVLGKTICETVTDEDGLEVDVPLLVREDLGGEDWDVVARVRLARDVERLLRVLWELLEEEREEGIDILSSGDGVADAGAGVGVADIDGLIEEDDGSVGVPAVGIEFDFAILSNGGWTKFHEEACER
jgi:hypothetical protein